MLSFNTFTSFMNKEGIYKKIEEKKSLYWVSFILYVFISMETGLMNYLYRNPTEVGKKRVWEIRSF